MSADSEHLRVLYEGVVKHDASNIEAVQYLATWHMERQSFQQVTLINRLHFYIYLKIILIFSVTLRIRLRNILPTWPICAPKMKKSACA